MLVPYETLPARLISSEEGNALVLDGAKGTVCLRYAFVTSVVPAHLLPSVILDDWGHEIRGLEMYRWVAENDLQFPRAEIFGLTPGGQNAQVFVRELEPMSRLRCYAYLDKTQSINSGRLVELAIVPEPGVNRPRPTKRPPDLSWPLGHSQLSWWAMAPDADGDFSLESYNAAGLV